MEENSLQQKIIKQLRYIKESVSGFKKSFDSKNIKGYNYTPYLESFNKVFDLNNSYANDYFQIIEKLNLKTILANNTLLMADISMKLKELSTDAQIRFSTKQKKQKEFDGLCKVCKRQIEQQSIQIMKNNLQQFNMTQLKNIFKRISEQQSRQSLFSPEDDKLFFLELNKTLRKKEEMLIITDNYLQQYIENITKNISQINNIWDNQYEPTSVPEQVNWQIQIKDQINALLLTSFKGKIPSWVQKMFQKFMKLKLKYRKPIKQSKCCQTDTLSQADNIYLQKEISKCKEAEENLTINQGLMKQIQQKNKKIKLLQIQIESIQEKTSYRRSKHKRGFQVSPQNEKRNQRKSSFEREAHQGQAKVLKVFINSSQSHHKANKNSSGCIENSMKVEQQKIQENYNQYLVNIYSSNQRDKPNSLSTRISEKNQFLSQVKVANPKNRNQSFLPTIQKSIKNEIEKLQTSKRLKKTSVLSTFGQNIVKTLQQKQSYTNGREQTSNNFDHQSQNTSIKKLEGNYKIDAQQPQTNSSKQKQNQFQNLKMYKSAISKVSSLLESKVQNLGQIFFKKSRSLIFFNGKKRQTSFSIESNTVTFSYVSRTGNTVKILDGESIKPKKLISKSSFETQFLQKINESANFRQSLKPKLKMKAAEVQTQQLYLQQIKNITNSVELCQIAEQFLKKSAELHSLHISEDLKIKNINKENNKINFVQKQAFQPSQVSQTQKFQQNFNAKQFKSDQRISCKSVFAEKNHHFFVDLTSNSQQETIIDKFQTENQNQVKNFPKYLETCLFTKNDLLLFLNEENSFKYELNMRQKYHKSPVAKLTEQQTHYFESVYRMVQQIKALSQQQYNHILSFIKYPYQTTINNFSIFNITKHISLESWLRCMARIKYYHQKCIPEQKKKVICCHIQNFVAKIKAIQADTVVFNKKQNQR